MYKNDSSAVYRWCAKEDEGEGGLGVGAILGIVAGGVVLVGVVGFVLWRRRKASKEEEGEYANMEE